MLIHNHPANQNILPQINGQIGIHSDNGILLSIKRNEEVIHQERE